MYSRRPKESHRDTIAYEADMLGFCAQALRARKHPTHEDMCVYLEAFLLHYRNLIRIFSGEEGCVANKVCELFGPGGTSLKGP
jgi:hypothetical protein